MKGKKFLIGIIAVPTLLFLTQSAMISYMLLAGSIRPGDRIYGDGVAPSYLGSYLSTIASFTVLVLLIYANYRVGKNSANSRS
ncbi:hypothetical protein [Oceanobacter mangrovi]|uniref:hypothetical protein n=1 Tax=Oceanobacter mangrovi TaxID=2862510 RepID=UPI001C8DCCCA|nr:hypothetical protein [Oceanobacter mangrovi]